MTKKEIPFGLWHSPVSPLLICQRKRFADIHWDSDGQTLIWLEGRSDRGVLVARPKDEAVRDITVAHSVRAGVGYGGGDYTVARGVVIFSTKDGRLYRRTLGSDQPKPITPPFGFAASPVISADGRWVVFVFNEDKIDLLSLVDIEGCGYPVKLAHGADFYMQPAWHPNGNFLAWIEWDHPNMPWDGTRLKMARVDGLSLVDEEIIAGNDQTPVSEPHFSPDGHWLSYIISNGEWDDLVLYNLQNHKSKVLVRGDRFLLSPPAWVQGVRSYDWRFDSKWIYYQREYCGLTSLWSVELETETSLQIDTSPYTYFSQLTASPVDDQFAVIGSAPTIPDRVLRWNGEKFKIEARSDSEDIDADNISIPKSVSWVTSDGETAHGLYYAPLNKEYTAAGVPPVIIHVHGGPTSSAHIRFTAETIYYTTRGYAVLELNYRGSTGYGHSYEKSIRCRWGDVDVEDAVSAVRALVELGLGDSKRMVIKGGSAGGYTVLNALVRYPGIFKAGVCLYGVSNLFNLAMETHKFEEHYTDSLVGILPEASNRFHDWSPIFHANQIRDPLAIFQGADDRVVPPNQSEEIVKFLQRGGIPHVYRLYAGEGHGFRKSETIADYLEQVERFLIQYVLFAPDGDINEN